ncbi:hypothetical protein [Blattabacterium cuenoti]|nr:hypothetical protein [Blattabacterium cuenoti]
METKKVMENIEIFFSEKGSYHPAIETIPVSGLPKNANIEISLIAYKN